MVNSLYFYTYITLGSASHPVRVFPFGNYYLLFLLSFFCLFSFFVFLFNFIPNKVYYFIHLNQLQVDKKLSHPQGFLSILIITLPGPIQRARNFPITRQTVLF